MRPDRDERRDLARRGRANVAVVLAALVIVGVTALIHWLQRSDVPQASAAEGATDAHVVRERSTERVPTARTVQEVEAAPSAAESTQSGSDAQRAAPSVLVVHVRRSSDESALAGATVTVNPWRDEPRVRTDENGDARFEFEGQKHVRAITVSATESTPGVNRYVDLQCFPGTTVETSIGVNSGAIVSGRVVDGDGSVVANATVDVWSTSSYPSRDEPDRSVSTDASGHFTISHVGPEFFAAAHTETLCCRSGIRGTAKSGASIEGVEIVLAPCVPIVGHVVDDRGAPLVDANLEIWGTSSGSDYRATNVAGVQSARWGSAYVHTSADGSFRIDGLADEGRSRTAWVEHDEALGVYAELDPRQADNRVTLARGVEVSGTVLRSDGSPAVDAKVSLGFTRGKARDVKTGLDGKFVARGLAREADSIVRVHHAGDAIWIDEHVEFAPKMSPLVIRLEPARALTGRVVDEDGRGVPHATVKIRGDREIHPQARFGEPTTWEWSLDMNETSCDELGRFRFDDLYDGTFELTAIDPQDADRIGKLDARSGSTELELRFGTATVVRFAGRVVDGQTRKPIRSFEVTPMLKDEDGGSWSGRSHVFESAEGDFSVGGLRPGEIELTVSAPGYARWSAGRRDVPAGTQQLEVPLTPARELRLRLVAVNGEPLESSAHAKFETRDGRQLQINSGPGVYTSDAQLAGEPETIAGLPAEVVRVLVTPPGFYDPIVAEFDLTAPLEGVQDIVVTLPSVRRLGIAVFVVPRGSEQVGVFDEDVRLTARPEPPSTLVTLQLLDAKRRVLSSGSMTPKDGAFEIKSTRGNTGSSSVRREASIELDDPGAATLEIRSDDCEPLTLDLASLPSGALQRLVLLRLR